MDKALESVTGRLAKSAQVKEVFGEPFEANGRTYVPVAQVGYGFGEGTKEGGTGVGGQVAAKPVGIVEINAEGARLIRFEPPWRLLAGVGIGMLLGMRAGWRMARRRRHSG
jgi:uncharacterized spore protein YtfJ